MNARGRDFRGIARGIARGGGGRVGLHPGGGGGGIVDPLGGHLRHWGRGRVGQLEHVDVRGIDRRRGIERLRELDADRQRIDARRGARPRRRGVGGERGQGGVGGRGERYGERGVRLADRKR